MTEAILPFDTTPLADGEDADAAENAAALAAAIDRQKNSGLPPQINTNKPAPHSHVLDAEIFSLALRTMAFSGEDRPVRFDLGPDLCRISITQSDTTFWVDFSGAPGEPSFSFEGGFGALNRLAKAWHRRRWTKQLQLELKPTESHLEVKDRSGVLRLDAAEVEPPSDAETAEPLRSAGVNSRVLAKALNIACMFAAKEERDDKLISISAGRLLAGKVRGACIIDAPELGDLQLTVTSGTARHMIKALARLGASGPVTWHDHGSYQIIRDDHCGLAYPVQSGVPQDVSRLLASDRRLSLETCHAALFNAAFVAAIPDRRETASAAMSWESGELILRLVGDRGRALTGFNPDVLHTEVATDLTGPAVRIGDLCACLTAFQHESAIQLSWPEKDGEVKALMLQGKQERFHLTAVLPALARTRAA